MEWLMSLYVAVLFFLLTPNILFQLPPGEDIFMVAMVHATIFAVVYHFTHKLFWNATHVKNEPEIPIIVMEGFKKQKKQKKSKGQPQPTVAASAV
uniref:Uncharacterized protein n=1 Tax=viral metagenome TaxID=1070528 RepID=A0A6C0DSD2_9ZZZZ